MEYHKLNTATVKHSYLLARMDIFNSLTGSQCFSTLDLRIGYWQVHLNPDRANTACITPYGFYKFKVKLFGLYNATSTLMELVLAG